MDRVSRRDAFTWTPTAENLGVNYFDLAIRGADGAQLDETQIKVEVTVPKVELGFTVRSIKLSPNGQQLVAWGAGKGQENRHPAHTGPDSIAVIEIKTAKVLASKELPQGVRDVAIDDRYVFIALASGNVLYRVDHQLSSSKRQFLQGQPQFVKKVSPTVLAIGEERTFEFFDAEKMVPVRNGLPNNLHPSAVSRFGAGKTVTMNGRVTDRESGELLRIVSSTLPNLATGRARNVSFHQHNQGATPAWGRKMSFNGMLSNHKGTRIAQPSNVSLATISEDYPVGILIASENEGQISKQVLKFCSLIDGTILQTSTIKEYSTRQPHQHSYGNQKPVDRGWETSLHRVAKRDPSGRRFRTQSFSLLRPRRTSCQSKNSRCPWAKQRGFRSPLVARPRGRPSRSCTSTKAFVCKKTRE